MPCCIYTYRAYCVYVIEMLGMCRGFVMADALVKGLRCGAIATQVSLKGLNETKDTEIYPGSAPRDGGKSLHPAKLYCLSFDYKGAESLDLDID